MKLLFKEGDGLGEGFLFLTNDEETRIFAEAEFWDLDSADKDQLNYFIEDANEELQ